MAVWRQPEAPLICVRPIPLSCALSNSAFSLQGRVISRHIHSIHTLEEKILVCAEPERCVYVFCSFKFGRVVVYTLGRHFAPSPRHKALCGQHSQIPMDSVHLHLHLLSITRFPQRKRRYPPLLCVRSPTHNTPLVMSSSLRAVLS